jgi:hypothetical protein
VMATLQMGHIGLLFANSRCIVHFSFNYETAYGHSQ